MFFSSFILLPVNFSKIDWIPLIFATTTRLQLMMTMTTNTTTSINLFSPYMSMRFTDLFHFYRSSSYTTNKKCNFCNRQSLLLFLGPLRCMPMYKCMRLICIYCTFAFISSIRSRAKRLLFTHAFVFFMQFLYQSRNTNSLNTK